MKIKLLFLFFLLIARHLHGQNDRVKIQELPLNVDHKQNEEHKISLLFSVTTTRVTVKVNGNFDCVQISEKKKNDSLKNNVFSYGCKTNNENFKIKGQGQCCCFYCKKAGITDTINTTVGDVYEISVEGLEYAYSILPIKDNRIKAVPGVAAAD